MEIDDVEVIELELKYCERCGGLWFRELDSEEVFCPRCVLQVESETPGSRRMRVQSARPGNHKTDGRGSGLEVAGGARFAGFTRGAEVLTDDHAPVDQLLTPIHR